MKRIEDIIRTSVIFLVSVLSVISVSSSAHALIRDAEIEATLRDYADPIFEVAGLKPSAVNIFIIQNDSINAFVAGGSNMFLHTGLIMRCDTADMLLGVIAHETGHIAGGHLARGTEKLKNAQIGAIMSYVLGAAAGVAAGEAGAAAAVITGSGMSIQRNILAFSRANEEAADQSALTYLDALNISASGMVKVFSLLQRNERMRPGSRDPYLQTHPLSGARMSHVRDHVSRSSIKEGQYPSRFTLQHQRMLAKLYSFIQTPERTLQRYPMSDQSLPARMARAVAYYKMPDLKRSLKEMDGLLAEYPNDAFLHELKGQILFENAQVSAALASYQKAIKLLPDAPLILTELAKVELAQNPPLLSSAITHLEQANHYEKNNPSTWRLLSTAYGKSGNKGMSSLALAEEALLRNNSRHALVQSEQAMQSLDKNSAPYQRASDIKLLALDIQKEKDNQ